MIEVDGHWFNPLAIASMQVSEAGTQTLIWLNNNTLDQVRYVNTNIIELMAKVRDAKPEIEFLPLTLDSGSVIYVARYSVTSVRKGPSISFVIVGARHLHIRNDEPDESIDGLIAGLPYVVQLTALRNIPIHVSALMITCISPHTEVGPQDEVAKSAIYLKWYPHSLLVKETIDVIEKRVHRVLADA